MLRLTIAVLGISSLCTASTSDDDLITSLPGADGLDLPNMYSGYLDIADSEKHVFYWLVEAPDPTKPVALWTNGGPGCSGLIGLMTEQGPIRPTSDGGLEVNPASWHTEATMLFVEQPAGVGFSYSDSKADYVTDDEQAAEDLYGTILAFFDKFPQYSGNDFYLTSESYGGHYLPTTTQYILSLPGAAASLNFKGFFLGNPWTDPGSNAVGRVQTLYGHGLVPKVDYDAWEAACLKTQGGPYVAECAAASAKVLLDSKWDGQNIDALTYPSCNTAPAGGLSQRAWLRNFGGLLSSSTLPQAGKSERALASDLVYDPCVDSYSTKYLNRLDVQQALHVNASSAVSGSDTVAWGECSFALDYNGPQSAPMMPLYEAFAADPNTRLKLEVYSGDDDSNCPLLGTLQWIYNLSGFTETASWGPWYYDDALYGSHEFAGFQAAWEGPPRNGTSDDRPTTLTLSTVHGAGHEVPTYKGQQALQLFAAFLARD